MDEDLIIQLTGTLDRLDRHLEGIEMALDRLTECITTTPRGSKICITGDINTNGGI